jgi:hypothetical protein
MARFCSECGTALEAGDRFCTKCGARTSVEAAAPAVAVAAVAPPTSAAPVAPAAPAITVTPAPRARERGGPSIVQQLRWEIVLGALVGAASAILGSDERRLDGFILGFATGFIAVLVGHALVSLVARVMKPLAVVLAILLLLGGVASAAGYYVVAPDMPGGLSRFVPDFQSLMVDLRPPSGTLRNDPPPAPVEVPADPSEARAQAVLAAVASTGLPVTAVTIEIAPDGQEALVVGLSYEELVGFSESFGFGEGLRAYEQLVSLKTLDLGGLGYVTTVLQDAQGRPLISISAPAGVVTSFRDGSASRSDLIAGLAFKGESRAGMLEAAQKALGR